MVVTDGAQPVVVVWMACLSGRRVKPPEVDTTGGRYGWPVASLGGAGAGLAGFSGLRGSGVVVLEQSTLNPPRQRCPFRRLS